MDESKCLLDQPLLLTEKWALTSVLPFAWQGLLARFASQAGLWQRAIKTMAELDALMALAYAAQFGGDGAPMCRPTFVEPEPSVMGSPSGHVNSSTAFTCS